MDLKGFPDPPDRVVLKVRKEPADQLERPVPVDPKAIPARVDRAELLEPKASKVLPDHPARPVRREFRESPAPPDQPDHKAYRDHPVLKAMPVLTERLERQDPKGRLVPVVLKVIQA